MAGDIPQSVYREALAAKARASVPEAGVLAIADYVGALMEIGVGAGVKAAIESAYRAGYVQAARDVLAADDGQPDTQNCYHAAFSIVEKAAGTP